MENLFYYDKIIVEIPTNKGANSYKLKIMKIGNTMVPWSVTHLVLCTSS